MNELESAIGDVFAKQNLQLAETWKQIKESGGRKTDCAKQVRRLTRGNLFMRNGLLIMLDRVWSET